MGTFTQIIVDSSKPLSGYTERLLKDVGAHNYARKPTWGIGGEIIDCNHAGFCIGHLAIYPARILTILGQDPAKAAPPAGFEDLFAAGKPCLDDPHATIYPAFDLIVTTYNRATEAARDAVAKVNDSELTKPNPNEKSRATFPTVGLLVNFLLNNHVAMHLGQISTWRRAMGLPTANV